MSSRKPFSAIANPAPANLSLRSSTGSVDGDDLNLPKRPWNANVKAYSKQEPAVPWYKRQSRTPVWTEPPPEKSKDSDEKKPNVYSFAHSKNPTEGTNLKKLKTGIHDNSSKEIKLGDIRGSRLFRQISIDKDSGKFHEWSNQDHYESPSNSPRVSHHGTPHSPKDETRRSSLFASDSDHVVSPTSMSDIDVDISSVYKTESQKKQRDSIGSVFGGKKNQTTKTSHTSPRHMSPIRYENENKFGKLHRQQEEARRQEELRKQQEEAKRLDELRKADEAKRKEELKELEEFNIRMEMKRVEDAKKLEDAKKSDESPEDSKPRPKLKRRKSFKDTMLDIFVRPLSRAASRAPSRAASRSGSPVRPSTPDMEPPKQMDIIVADTSMDQSQSPSRLNHSETQGDSEFKSPMSMLSDSMRMGSPNGQESTYYDQLSPITANGDKSFMMSPNALDFSTHSHTQDKTRDPSIDDDSNHIHANPESVDEPIEFQLDSVYEDNAADKPPPVSDAVVVANGGSNFGEKISPIKFAHENELVLTKEPLTFVERAANSNDVSLDMENIYTSDESKSHPKETDKDKVIAEGMDEAAKASYASTRSIAETLRSMSNKTALLDIGELYHNRELDDDINYMVDEMEVSKSDDEEEDDEESQDVDEEFKQLEVDTQKAMMDYSTIDLTDIYEDPEYTNRASTVSQPDNNKFFRPKISPLKIPRKNKAGDDNLSKKSTDSDSLKDSPSEKENASSTRLHSPSPEPHFGDSRGRAVSHPVTLSNGMVTHVNPLHAPNLNHLNHPPNPLPPAFPAIKADAGDAENFEFNMGDLRAELMTRARQSSEASSSRSRMSSNAPALETRQRGSLSIESISKSLVSARNIQKQLDEDELAHNHQLPPSGLSKKNKFDLVKECMICHLDISRLPMQDHLLHIYNCAESCKANLIQVQAQTHSRRYREKSTTNDAEDSVTKESDFWSTSGTPYGGSPMQSFAVGKINPSTNKVTMETGTQTTGAFVDDTIDFSSSFSIPRAGMNSQVELQNKKLSRDITQKVNKINEQRTHLQTSLLAPIADDIDIELYNVYPSGSSSSQAPLETEIYPKPSMTAQEDKIERMKEEKAKRINLVGPAIQATEDLEEKEVNRVRAELIELLAKQSEYRLKERMLRKTLKKTMSKVRVVGDVLPEDDASLSSPSHAKTKSPKASHPKTPRASEGDSLSDETKATTETETAEKPKEHTVDPDIEVPEHLKKYHLMLKRQVPVVAVVARMTTDGIGSEDQKAVLKTLEPAASESSQPSSEPELPEHLKRFLLMLKRGVPEQGVIAKMSMEAISNDDQKLVFRALHPPEKPPELPEHLKQFELMLKRGVPMPAVIAKMTMQGISPEEQKLVTKPPETDKEIELPEHLKKFQLMLKRGVPVPAVTAKMTMEGISPEEQRLVLNSMDPTGGSSGVKKKDKDDSSTSSNESNQGQGPKLINLYWDIIEREKIESSQKTSWKIISTTKTKTLLLDKEWDNLVAQFTKKDTKAKKEVEAVASPRDAKSIASMKKVLSMERIMSVSIVISVFKSRNLEVDKICFGINNLDYNIVNMDDALRVKDILPSDPKGMDQEVKAFKDLARDKNFKVEDLIEAEQAMYKLYQVDNLRNKISVLLFLLTWTSIVKNFIYKCEILASTTEMACSSKGLSEVLHTILCIGNSLNNGTSKGGAIGFKLGTLLKLHTVKSSNNVNNVLDFLVQTLYARHKSGDVASALALAVDDEFSAKINVSKSLSLTDLESEFKSFETNLKLFYEILQKEWDDPDSTNNHMSELKEQHKHISHAVATAREEIERVKKDIKEFEVFYFEPPDSSKNMFSIFDEFITQLRKSKEKYLLLQEANEKNEKTKALAAEKSAKSITPKAEASMKRRSSIA